MFKPYLIGGMEITKVLAETLLMEILVCSLYVMLYLLDLDMIPVEIFVKACVSQEWPDTNLRDNAGCKNAATHIEIRLSHGTI